MGAVPIRWVTSDSGRRELPRNSAFPYVRTELIFCLLATPLDSQNQDKRIERLKALRLGQW